MGSNALDGADLVREYPFSLRGGVSTAISHGLWLNIPDYDAPTQLVKPLQPNTRDVDDVMTIPKGTLFPMCGMNLAFDRELIGPATYLASWVMANQLKDTMICGQVGVPRYRHSFV